MRRQAQRPFVEAPCALEIRGASERGQARRPPRGAMRAARARARPPLGGGLRIAHAVASRPASIRETARRSTATPPIFQRAIPRMRDVDDNERVDFYTRVLAIDRAGPRSGGLYALHRRDDLRCEQFERFGVFEVGQVHDQVVDTLGDQWADLVHEFLRCAQVRSR
jgi:hypothetical protein